VIFIVVCTNLRCESWQEWQGLHDFLGCTWHDDVETRVRDLRLANCDGRRQRGDAGEVRSIRIIMWGATTPNHLCGWISEYLFPSLEWISTLRIMMDLRCWIVQIK
jgi:hypothetical protein